MLSCSTQKGYKGTSFYAFSTSQATNLTVEGGFEKASDGYFQPDYGPQKGKDLTFTIQSTSGNSIRSGTEELFRAQMKAMGSRSTSRTTTPTPSSGPTSRTARSRSPSSPG